MTLRCDSPAGCARTDTRDYGTGRRCPDHTPAAVAGRAEPPIGDTGHASGRCHACGGSIPADMDTHPTCDPDVRPMVAAYRRAIARHGRRR